MEEIFELMTLHEISVYVDPNWRADLGLEKWVAGQRLSVDEGSMGSSMTGWMHGDGLTMDGAVRAATPLLAVLGVLSRLPGSQK